MCVGILLLMISITCHIAAMSSYGSAAVPGPNSLVPISVPLPIDRPPPNTPKVELTMSLLHAQAHVLPVGGALFA